MGWEREDEVAKVSNSFDCTVKFDDTSACRS